MLLKRIANTLRPAAKFAGDHATGMCAFGFVVGLAATVYFSWKDAPKAKEVLDSMDEDATPMEKAKAIAPIATRTAVAAGVTLGSGLGLCKVASKAVKTASNVATTCSLLSDGYNRLAAENEGLKTAAAKVVGEEKLNDIQREAVKAKMQQAQAVKYDTAEDARPRICVTGHGDDLFYDSWSGRYFLSDINYLKKVINDLNYQLMNDMFINLNEYYVAVGLPPVDAGQHMGWNVDFGQIDVHYYSEMNEYDKPYTIVYFRTEPQYEGQIGHAARGW